MPKIKPTSSQIYNALAPYYKHYSENKSRYLRVIDELVLTNLPQHTRRILDVGCGDGIRGNQLFKRSGAAELWMMDSSEKMYKKALAFQEEHEKILKLDILEKVADDIPSDYFDAVWCLWNVLGHITNYADRVTAIRAVKRMLRSGGRLLLDVSNRYNVSYYGPKIVGGNMWNDFVRPNPDNGTVEYTIHVDGADIDSYCHFFNPNEIPHICEEVGLNTLLSVYVDYSTGQVTDRWRGHIFYSIEKP